MWERVERNLKGKTFSLGKGGLIGFLVGPLSSTGFKDGDSLQSERGTLVGPFVVFLSESRGNDGTLQSEGGR